MPRKGSNELSESDVQRFAADVRERHGLKDLWLTLHPSGGLHLHLIVVEPADRHAGRAERALVDIVAFADRHGKTIVLSPTSEFGASRRRLEVWYRRQGFRLNRGRSKDYRYQQLMIRDPEQDSR